MTLSSLIVPLVINWLVLFVALYVVTEYGHYYLYEQGPPYLAGRAAGGALVLALMLLWRPVSFDTMFTSKIHETVLHGIAWFLVFMFVLRFHPWHAAGLGVATMLLVPGLAFLAVDSFNRSRGRNPIPVRQPSKPFRQTIPATPGPPPVMKPAEPPAAPAP
jgi:hypothetical protein